MLAAVGWPVIELLHPSLANAMGVPDLLAAGAKAPSVLNGGLENISPLFFAGVFVIGAVVDNAIQNIQVIRNDIQKNRQVGDLGFDPLGFCSGANAEDKRVIMLSKSSRDVLPCLRSLHRLVRSS
jgi:hypothetical protein